MRQVFAVTRGAYSDYQVAAVAPTEEHAKAVADALQEEERYSDDYRVEAMPWFDEGELPERVTTLMVSQEFKLVETCVKLDNVPNYEERTYWSHELDNPPKPVAWTWGPVYRREDVGILRVSGTDEERVRKTFSDLRAQIIADPAAWSQPRNSG